MVRRRIVDVVGAGPVGRAFEAPADHVDFAVDSNDDQMIARYGQGRRFGPYARFRIKYLVGAHHDPVETAPADHVDFAVHHRGAGRPARHFHRRKDAPGIAHCIVFKRLIAGILVDRSSKTAEGVDFSAARCHSEVISQFRQWRPRSP